MIDFAAAREAMVDSQVRPSDVTAYPIIEAMLDVPREDYVPENFRSVAYLGDHIPLAPGRVLLDPRVFAKLLDALDVTRTDLVLDVGCGLGYSSAVIARIAQAVIALEEDEGFAAEAEARIAAHSVDNTMVQTGPLTDGVARHGPYDGILIEGGVQTVPEGLTAQLKEGGRIVAIFGDAHKGQARIGLKSSTGVVWRRAFDATAPVLPGFRMSKKFEF